MQQIPRIRLIPQALALFTCLTLFGCDFGQGLVINVAPKKELSASIFGNKNILPAALQTGSDKVFIRVPSSDSSTDYHKLFTYRVGAWDKITTAEFANNIDSIILQTTTGKIVVTGKENIENYLQKNINGRYHNMLTITVN